MDKEDRYIDDLFRQKFSGEGATIPPSGGEWVKLSKVIRKRNFLRFSPGSFNVYYLSALIAMVATVGLFVLPPIIGNKINETVTPPVKIQTIDILSKRDSLHEKFDSTVFLKSESKKVSCCEKSPRCQLMKCKSANDKTLQQEEGKDKAVNQEISKETGDSLSKTNEKNDPVSVEKADEKKSQLQVAPADTIIKTDTIHIQKKGVQFKRKKRVF
jgi:hypothetical protein